MAINIEKLAEDYFESDPNIERGSSDPSIISEQDLKLFYKCPYSYFTKKHLGFSKTPFSVQSLKAIFFKNLRRQLFRNNRLKAPEIKHPEQMSKEELKQFFSFESAESYGKSVMMRWQMFIKAIQKENEIVQSFEGELGSTGFHLSKIAEAYYNFSLENLSPIISSVNSQKVFTYKNLKIKIGIPELRSIRENNNSNNQILSLENPTYTNPDSELDKSVLITLKLLGLSRIIKNYPEFYIQRWKLDEEKIKDLVNNKTQFMPELIYRHINLKDKKITIETTQRTDVDLENLEKKIESFINATTTESFPPNQSNCFVCPYNIVDANLDPICRKRDSTKPLQVPYECFKIRSFKTTVSVSEKAITILGIIEKDNEVLKPVAKYNIMLDETSDKITAISFYTSNLHGLDYETRILEKADKLLEERAKNKTTTKPIIHTINFQKDFNVAGKQEIKSKLTKLGYESQGNVYAKIYTNSKEKA